MKSKHLLLFSIALILLISTFVLAQQKPNKKIPPGQLKQQEKTLGKDKENSHIKKGNGELEGYQNNNSYKKYKSAKKITICHSEGEENVTISVNENALEAHLAHGDSRGECNYNDDGNPDDFILERRNKRSQLFTNIIQAEDLIELSNKRIEIAKNQVEIATSKIDQLKKQPEINAENIQQKEAAINKVQLLIQELEQQVSNTRLKLQRDRQLINDLKVD